MSVLGPSLGPCLAEEIRMPEVLARAGLYVRCLPVGMISPYCNGLMHMKSLSERTWPFSRSLSH